MGTFHKITVVPKSMNGLIGMIENNYRWLRYKWLDEQMGNIYFLWMVVVFLSLCYIKDQWSESRQVIKDEKKLLMNQLREGKISLTEYHELLDKYETKSTRYNYKPSERPDAPLQKINTKKAAFNVRNEAKTK